ncbi:MAG: response regulator [Candidatus Omnitrophica bacterium]|nr:response regulator [Candidatus Omnitrophota bacterium]
MPEKKRIFIADDDQVVLDSLQKLLAISGFEVAVSLTSKGMVEAIKSFHPHLILLDLLMPGVGGLEICEFLNNDKDTKNIPIIILSGLAKDEDIKKAYHLGIIDYITKPYDFNTLLKAINKAIAYKESSSF